MRLTREEYQLRYRKQLEELDLIGYYKIASGKDSRYYTSFQVAEPLDYYHMGRVTYGIFYNPDTKDIGAYCETDWDREGLDDFYNRTVSSISVCDCPVEVGMDYNKQCEIAIAEENLRRKAERFKQGIISEGDTIEIIKGRKLPIGAQKVVQEFRPWTDCYGRVQTIYAVFTDGTKTNVNNCKLIAQKGE